MPSPRGSEEAAGLHRQLLAFTKDFGTRLATLVSEYERELASLHDASAVAAEGPHWLEGRDMPVSGVGPEQEHEQVHHAFGSLGHTPMPCPKESEGDILVPLASPPSRLSAHSIQIWSEWLPSHEEPDEETTQGPGMQVTASHKKALSSSVRTAGADSVSTVVSDAIYELTVMHRQWGLARLVSRPTSKHRLAWDVVSLGVLTYDILTLPLIAFNYSDDSLKMATTVFWSLDMPMCFLAGYNDRGKVELRVSRTSGRYLRSWFIWDVLVILADWISFFAGFNSVVDAARLGKFLRIGRLLRILRLMRIVKLIVIFESLTAEICASDNIVAALVVFKLLAGVMLIVHFIGCGYYAVGLYSIGVYERTWLTSGPQDYDATDASFNLRYITAFHWAIAQFTPAPNNHHPANEIERWYAVTSIFLGFVSFATFVASITATMTALRHKNSEKLKRNEMVRRFLEQNFVALQTSDMITAFLRQHNPRKSFILESEVVSLRLLPPGLLRQLHYEVYCQTLARHPLFYHLQAARRQTVVSICHDAASMTAYAKAEEVFNFGNDSRCMFFVTSGLLQYFAGTEEDSSVMVEKNSWMCEVALWIKWSHRGRLTAIDYVHLVVINAEMFRSLARPEEISQALKVYAGLFAERQQSPFMEVHCSVDESQELAQRCWGSLSSGPGALSPSLKHQGPGRV